MNLTRNQAILVATIVLVIISLGAFALAKMTDQKEKDAARNISDMYGETFIAVNSNASLMSNQFTVTVQSEQTNNVYAFEVAGDAIDGRFYNENVNIELNQLIESFTNSLAMVNATMPKLDQPATLSDAGIEKIDALIITPKAWDEQLAAQIAVAIQKETGPVPIQFQLLIVEDETDYEGVTFEIKNYFQRSTVTKESFNSLKFKEQQFEF